MSPRPSPLRLDPEFWELHQSAANLTRYACIISSRHIKDGALRGRFNREMAYYVRQVVEDVRSGRVRTEEGLQTIEFTWEALGLHSLEIARKSLGMVAGVAQVAAGGQLCATGGGCVIGLPLALHGGNNIYENGSNLITGRSDAEGPIKKLYQKGAELLGGTARQGNIAYGLTDIGFSAYGLLRKVVAPGKFKLFRRIPSDHVRSFRLMKKNALIFEIGTNYLTLEQIYWEASE